MRFCESFPFPILRLILILILNVGIGERAALAQSPRSRLEEVEEQLGAEQGEQRRLRAEEKSVLSLLDAAEKSLRAAEDEATAAQARLAGAEDKSRKAAQALAAADARVAAQREKIVPRLLARYKLGRHGYLRILLAAEGAHELRRRQRLLTGIVESDLVRLRALRDEVAAQARLADAADAARAENAAAARAAILALERAEEARVEREEALLAVREAKLLGQQAIAELSDARSDLRTLIARLPPAPSAPDKPFDELLGRLPPPVKGRLEVPFGRRIDPRFNTVTLQKGWDLRAPVGAPVAVVHGGTVAHAGWFRGYGLLLIVDHGEGFYTLYAHLKELQTAVGEELEAGEVIGSVGDTGSLKGPYLYFEIRRGPEAEDPALWVAGIR